MALSHRTRPLPNPHCANLQDESVIPPSLAKALDRVRQGADVMPAKQLHGQLEKSFGVDWRSKVASFDETPIAAASIGQVGYVVGTACQHASEVLHRPKYWV